MSDPAEETRVEQADTPLAISTRDRRMTVRFAWSNDRFAHQVFARNETKPCAVTVDGDAAQPWPASPPLQQLSREVIDDQSVILGVGSAGRSHWSVSVVPTETETGGGLRFEWACCHKERPAFVGVTYETNERVNVQADENSASDRREDGTTIVKANEASTSGTVCWSYTLTIQR